MIFSSYYDIPELITYLPSVGDTVTYNVPSQRQPATIIKRYRRKIFGSSSVFVRISSSVQIYPIEVIQYWPEIGDTVNVSIAQYLAWQAQERSVSIHTVKIPPQLFHPCVLTNIRGQQSIIESDGFLTIVPTSILRVEEVMGVRKRDVDASIQRLANPEKETADASAINTFEKQQLNLLTVLGVEL